MRSIKRVFLITVDCLRADHTDCIGGGGLTPHIDKLARESIFFTRAFSNGPGTNQSFPAILTSTYFLMHGGMRLLPHYTSLAEVLSSDGFKTVAFHSNPFLSKVLGWGRGFDEFYDFMDIIKSPSAFVTRQQKEGLTIKMAHFASTILGADRNTKVQRFLKKIYYNFSHLQIPYLDGKGLNGQVIKWIEKNIDEKLFLWAHYMDPHCPYIPPSAYLSGFSSRKEAFDYNLSVDYNNLSGEEVITLRSLYEKEVRHTDACIGEFLQYLKDKNILDGSLILLTADHGHAFMEHGRFGHAYDILYNEVIHVPLVIFGLDEDRKIDAEIQLLDVPPTILDLLDIRKPSSFMGRSLLDAENSSATIFSESAKPDLINLRYDISKKAISCIKDKIKLIINELQGTIELYDLEKDFQEKNNRFESEKELYSELASLIKKHLSYEESYRQKWSQKTPKIKLKKD